MTDLEKLIKHEKITLDLRPIESMQPHISSWRVLLTYGRKTYETSFHTAVNLAPTTADVINALRGELRTFDETFETWAKKLNYNTDSRSAYATWEAVRDSAPKFKSFLGPRYPEFMTIRHR